MVIQGNCVFLPEVFWQQAERDFIPPGNIISVIVAGMNMFDPGDFLEFALELDSEEQARDKAFINEQSRKQFLLGHYLLRRLLAPMVGLKPRELSFGSAFNKKPVLVNGQKPVHFNISHAGEKVVICLCHEDPVGVDIEKINPDFDFRSFAAEHFSAAEKLELGQEGEKARLNFFLIWTRKESCMKLTGEGISDDLKNMDMSTGKGSGDGKGPFVFSTILDGYAVSIACPQRREIRYSLFQKD